MVSETHQASGAHGVQRSAAGGPRPARLLLLSPLLLTACGLGSAVFPTDKGLAAPAVPAPVVRQLVLDGQTLRVTHLFTTAETRTTGLQGKKLAPGTSAVFWWDGKPVTEGFWMRSTPEPLSLLWVREGRVLGTAELRVCSLSCPTYKAPGPFDLAVEAPSGTFRTAKPGTEVTLT